MPRVAIRKPNLLEVEYVGYRLACELMGYDEPIPPFETRYPEKLESCLATPFQTYNRRSLYPTFERKAAALFYLMIKNHPFKNGNKRIAVTTLLYFLHTNNRWLNVGNEDLYEFAKTVAASNSSEKDRWLETIYKFITRYQVRESRPIVH